MFQCGVLFTKRQERLIFRSFLANGWQERVKYADVFIEYSFGLHSNSYSFRSCSLKGKFSTAKAVEKALSINIICESSFESFSCVLWLHQIICEIEADEDQASRQGESPQNVLI